MNGAFRTVLTALGDRSSINVAGVHGASGPERSALGNHGATIVEELPPESNPGGRWWVDVGLGDVLHDPMPLMDDVVQQGSMQFGIKAVGQHGVGDWHLSADASCWLTGVNLVDRPVEMSVFTDQRHFNATSPDSGFAKVITAQL